MPPYSYRPLDTTHNEIRLLKLISSTGVLKVEALHVSLDENPKYIALSYTWGDPQVTKSIEILGEAPAPEGTSSKVISYDFQATENLEAALRQIQDVDLEQGEEIRKSERGDDVENARKPLLWADAICINQNDDVEKGYQIRLMARIYTQCSRVCVWLGESADDSDLVMDMASAFMKRLTEMDASSSSEQHSRGREVIMSMLSDAACFALGEIAENPLKAIWAVIHFLWRPWFSRLWIIQEIVLAPEDIVLCGAKTLDLWTLIAFLHQIHPPSFKALEELRAVLQVDGTLSNETNSSFSEILDIHSEQLKVVVDRQLYQISYIEMLKKSIKTHGFPPFRALMPLVEGRGFTDSRDAVYALLSLSGDARDWEVNYGSTRLQVFRYITKKIIDTEESLDIICYARLCTHQSHQQISWVPRFDCEELDCECQLMARYSLTGPRSSFAIESGRIQSPYNASKSAIPNVVFDEDSGELKTSGIIVDYVESVLEKPSWSGAITGTSSEPTKNIPDQWFLLASKPRDIQQDAAQLRNLQIEPNSFDSLWRTLVANRKSDHEVAPPPLIWGEIFRAWLEASDGIGFTAPLDIETLPTGLAEHKLILEEFSAQVAVALSGYKTLITTKSGRLGLARTQSKPGDLVCILMGCSVPMILRPVPSKSERYILIGESYIQGIMDGEIIDEVDDGKYELEEIFIV